MNIEKNGKICDVTEKAALWVVSRKIGALTVEIKVPKDVCKDEAGLRAYVEREEIF